MNTDEVSVHQPLGQSLANPSWKELPELEIREFREADSHDVKEFLLNNLMQRTRLSNQFVYQSPVWISVYLSAIAWATNHIKPWMYADWGRWAFLCCAITALCLVPVDYFTYAFYEKRTQLLHKADGIVKDPRELAKSKNSMCWVAYYNDGLVGCIVLDRPTPKSSSAEILHWYVRARYRQKGLGGDLLLQAVEHAKKTNCHKLLIKTSSIHKLANKCLKKFTFVKVSSKPDSNVYFRMVRMKDYVWTIDPQQSQQDVVETS